MEEIAILVDNTPGSDKVRRRRSDVQGKLYSFLNRSAQSLSRSNSQSGRSRRVKDKDDTENSDRDGLRAGLHATSSRTPAITSGNAASETSSRLPSSIPPSRSRTAVTDHPRKSSSPPSTPPNQLPLSNAPPSFTYNTPPQTPARSRKYSTSTSPTSAAAGRDLLLNRPLARPITPSNSTSSRKVFGIPIPSPTHRKATLEVEEPLDRRGHKLRSGSGSSNEPLLHDHSPSSGSARSAPRHSMSTPRPTTPRLKENRTPLPTPQSSLPRSYRSNVTPEEPPASPTTSSRRGTPRLDFWRSITPRAPSSQGDREKDKGKQPSTTPDASRREKQVEQSDVGLVSPQPRPPGPAFLPRFHRTPATPQKGEEHEASNTVRLDSFMSDSLPVQQNDVKPSQVEGQSGLTRQPAFTTQTNVLRSPRTPAPERKSAQAGLSIQRSNSAPGSRGRLSPCLRIPSPKFLTRERSRSKDTDKEKEKEKEKSMAEKRRLTAESVGAPILREPRTHLHTHSHTVGSAVGHGAVEKGGLKAAKTSLVQLRRAAHGTFDFERPGSRTSSKSGQSESRGTRSDDERDKEKEREKEKEKEFEAMNELDVRRMLMGRSPKPPEPPQNIRTKLKAPSPVPPLPTRTRLKPRSPPPPPTGTRARSPLATHPGGPSSHGHSQSHSHVHIDDSALPRLSSSTARRNSSSNQHFRTPGYGSGHRTPTSLPHFSFEPAAPRVPSPPSIPPKAVREGGGQYVDTRTGLIMYSPRTPTSATRDEMGRRVEGGRRHGGTGTGNGTGTSFGTAMAASISPKANGHAAAATSIPQRELEEATAVITQFKSALDEAGFATLQKYVRRYDAKIIPLDGVAGLLVRVQRLLDTSAPRVDERRKRQLYESFVRVVRVSQVS